jgi:hypothetical protein
MDTVKVASEIDPTATRKMDAMNAERGRSSDVPSMVVRGKITWSKKVKEWFTGRLPLRYGRRLELDRKHNM